MPLIIATLIVTLMPLILTLIKTTTTTTLNPTQKQQQRRHENRHFLLVLLFGILLFLRTWEPTEERGSPLLRFPAAARAARTRHFPFSPLPLLPEQIPSRHYSR